MITDLRSSKVSEASSNKGNNNNDVAELVWWFGKSSEQYRIRGKLVFVGGGHFETDHDEFLARARKEQWGNLSDVAREQFYWKDPGVPYEDQNAVPSGARDEQGKLLPPPDRWGMDLQPRQPMSSSNVSGSVSSNGLSVIVGQSEVRNHKFKMVDLRSSGWLTRMESGIIEYDG
eukprot:scaffold2957_cov55-Attheya_sp.AAC.3